MRVLRELYGKKREESENPIRLGRFLPRYGDGKQDR